MSFETNEVRDVFLRWATLWDGNPQETSVQDNSLFYEFALKFFQNESILLLKKEDFVRYAKKHIHTSLTHNRGLIQRYYDRLVIINEFLKDMINKESIIINK